MDLAFDYDRKEAKTHGEATGHGYLFVTGAALEGGRFMIIDDVGTSMATKLDLVKKIRWLSPRAPKPLDIKSVCLAVDREQTQAVYDDQGRVREGRKGPDAFAAFTEETKVPVHALIGIRECIKYLYAEGIPVNIDGGDAVFGRHGARGRERVPGALRPGKLLAPPPRGGRQWGRQ